MSDARRSPTQKWSCLLLGNEPLVTRIAGVVSQRGHKVVAVVTDAPAVRRWCEAAGILNLTRHEYPKFLEQQPVDLIASVTYPWLIPVEILRKARRAAVNYHDGPLPRYAGINASAWSLCNGERQHAIVWHQLVEGLDAGHILERRDIELEARETSLSLNMRNAVAALESFVPLLERLERGDVVGKPQDPRVPRTVFSRHDRPAALCTLDLQDSATNGDRLIRACDFGHFDNRFGLVKVVHGTRAVIVHKARVATTEAVADGAAAAGTVLAIDDQGLTVACGDGRLRLERFSTLLGEELSPPQAAAALGVSVGTLVNDRDRAARVALTRPVAEAEPFFVAALNDRIPVEVPLEQGSAGPPQELAVDVPPSFAARLGAAATDGWITAFALLLSVLAKQDTFDLALVDEAVRTAVGTAGFLFFPSVPLRLELAMGQSFSAACAAAGAARTAVRRRGPLLKDLIVRHVALAADQGLARGGLGLAAVLVGDVEAPPGMALGLRIAGDRVWLCSDGRIGEARLRTFAQSLACIARMAAEDPGRTLQQLDLVDAETSARQLGTWNDTARPFPDSLRIHDLFAQRAAENSDAIALVFEGETRTFGAVEAAANRMANALRARGLEPGGRVGIALDRGFDLVVAMLAVAKAGGAYVPLDVAYPAERVRFMLADAACSLLLTSAARSSGFDPTLVLDVGSREVTLASSEPPSCPAQATDVAYVIYTSGSTGQPKGVMLSHRAVVNTLDWVNRTFHMTPADRLLFVTSPSFDLSVYDVFGALGAGAAVEIASSALLADPARMARKLCEPGITVWDSAPAALTRLVPFLPTHAPTSSLRLVMLSGDWIPMTLPPLLQRTFPGVSVESLGGATEAAIWSNHHAVRALDPSWVSIPYGRPIQNARYYVLDGRLRPLPVGIPGDLYIAGTCLAEGYLKRPELTADRFVRDPFRPGERMYKTGDLARYFPDGVIEFLGRADRQTKIRGFRVELGEVEAAIAKVPGVRDVVCQSYVDASASKSLAAYVVPEPQAMVDEQTIKDAVARTLPEFMVPAQVLLLPALPVTANGKIDRQRLPSPTARATTGEVVAASTELEAKLVAIWEQLLERKPIGVTDDFFSLGGHSLLAVMLVTTLKNQLGISVPLSRVLEHPTIATFAAAIADEQANRRRSRNLVALRARGSKPPLVLVGGIGGYTFTYRNFPRLLGGDQPVFTLMAVGAEDANEPIDHSIEHTAAVYEEELAETVPSGPVVIGGFSFGALPAFDLARRLVARGREVPLFISFDGFAPGYPTILPPLERIAAHVREFISRDGPARRAYLRERMAHVRERVYRALGRLDALAPANPFADADMSERMNRFWAQHLRARHRYEPRACLPSDLLLVRVSQPYRWVATKMDDPNYGWGSYVSGEISLVTVPGEHTDLFAPTNESLIAQALSAHLTRYTPTKVHVAASMGCSTGLMK